MINLQQLENANKTLAIIKEIDKALKDTENTKFGDAVAGGIPGVSQVGYNAVLSQYSDGSGSRINMNGCYVGKEMLEATRQVLLNKKGELLKYVESLGVDIS